MRVKIICYAHLVPTRRVSRSPEQAGPDKQKKAAEGWEHCSFSPTPLYLPRMPGGRVVPLVLGTEADTRLEHLMPTVETRRCVW